jgi:hypothetical protein
MMEAEYEVRVLKDKLALLMNGDASPNNNLIMVSFDACTWSMCDIMGTVAIFVPPVV